MTHVPRLWLVQVNKHPHHVYAHFGNNTFLVLSTNLSTLECNTCKYAFFEPRYKHKQNLTASDIVVKCVDANKRLSVPHMKLGHSRVFVHNASVAQIKQLAESNNVIWIAEHHHMVHHSLASRATLLGTPALSPPFGNATRLFISDTKLDPYHCMFYSSALPSYETLFLSGALPLFNGTGKVIGVMPFEYQTGTVTDPTPADGAHGTSTAGVMAGASCGGNQGVASAAQFLFMDLSFQGDSLVTPQDWTRTFQVVANHNLSVHSVSYGMASGDGMYSLDAEAFDEAAYVWDVLHSVSAGNEGPFLVSSPATCKNCLSVGACMSNAANFPLYSSTQRAQMPLLYDWSSVASFSSVGPKYDDSRAPILCAPGVSVQIAYGLAATEPGHTDYVYGDGTSFASPAIAGMMALIDEFFTDVHGNRSSASMKMAALIVGARPTQRIVDVGSDTLTLSTNAPPDLSYGVPLLVLDDLTMLDRLQTNGSRQAYCFTANASIVRVALAWIDPPAHLYAAQLLINDLNLVVSHAGVEYTNNNHLDNTERVSFNATIGLTVRVIIEVSGIVSNLVQNYSLALLGVAPDSDSCGTCLTSDRTGCTTGFVPACNETSGVDTCVLDACPAGTYYNATSVSCVATPSSTPCSIPHGSGLLVNGVCEVQQCDANYVFSGNGCMCQPTMECPDIQVIITCVDNEFISCAAAAAQSFPKSPLSTEASTETDSTADILYGFLLFGLVVFVFVLLCLFLSRIWPPEDNLLEIKMQKFEKVL